MTWRHISPPSSTALLPPPWSHREAEAAATLGAPEFTKGLLDGARGVETLSQQQDTIEEEKWCQAIDHVLEVFDAGTVTQWSQVKFQNQQILLKSKKIHKSENLIKSHSQGGHDRKVLNIAGEVCLHQDFSLGQRFVPTATK